MFLALKEIMHSKFRYFLVIGLLFLISYLVFFLTGLAFGLAQSNRTAIDKWDADNIVLADGVDNRLAMSQITEEEWDTVKADEQAIIAVQAMLFENDNVDESLSAQLFGINKDTFLAPNIIEGKMFQDKNEVVVDENFAIDNELDIGDKLTFNNSDDELTIVGLTENAQLSVQPVVYVDFDDYQNLESTFGSNEQSVASAVVTRGSVSADEEVTDIEMISDFISELPGYSAQNATFILMIGFLIVIAAIVIGIFIYVLTLQKESIFGILKAQGIANSYLIVSVVGQTFVLAIIGVLLAMGLNYASSLLLPAAVPFSLNWALIGITAGLIVLFAILGGLFSARTITKIDPLEAIG